MELTKTVAASSTTGRTPESGAQFQRYIPTLQSNPIRLSRGSPYFFASLWSLSLSALSQLRRNDHDVLALEARFALAFWQVQEYVAAKCLALEGLARGFSMIEDIG